jgi:hypothetical protein
MIRGSTYENIHMKPYLLNIRVSHAQSISIRHYDFILKLKRKRTSNEAWLNFKNLKESWKMAKIIPSQLLKKVANIFRPKYKKEKHASPRALQRV